MNDFCHLKEFKKMLHCFPAVPPTYFSGTVYMFIFPVERMVKVELLFRSLFLSKLFFLKEVSLSLSRLSEVTIEINNRRDLEYFSINF